MHRISVLIGIYNCALTLQEALDSLYAQTYQNFQIILCDDGSVDNTYKIAQENANMHDNIILIKNDRNRGLNYTLNKCLKYADTEYCARMDGDDISMPDRFEKEINFLDSHQEYTIVSTPMIYFDEQGEFKKCKGGYEPSKAKCARHTPFTHAPCMIKTEAYKSVGGYTVDKKLLRVEDYHLWIKMFSKGYRGYMLKEPLYKMRDNRYAGIRRTFKNRLGEMYVKHLAIKELNLPKSNYIYCLKPLILGVLPTRIYNYFHKR